MPYAFLRRVWVSLQQGFCGYDESWCAEPALQCRIFQEGLLNRVETSRAGNTFNRCDFMAFDLHTENQA
jgi:hypothetical protein|tara:strand:- start:894 stop:1100 length:207 start_codon:yes stop_codon:yes gene_type:complete